jgi:hypothetical protein
MYKEYRMKTRRAFAVLLGFVLILSGCGSSNTANSGSSGNVNGNWTATLTNLDGSPAFAFNTTFTQMSGSSVSVTNLTFTTASPCFVSGETETAAFVLNGNFSGSVTGSFQLNVKSGNPSGDTLTLNGTVNNNTITGTWTLIGISSGCSGSGNFQATKM